MLSLRYFVGGSSVKVHALCRGNGIKVQISTTGSKPYQYNQQLECSSDMDIPLDGVRSEMLDTYLRLLPVKNQEMTAVLKGFVNSSVEELSYGVRAIRMGENTHFLCPDFKASDTIYERSFYPHLVNSIRCASRRVLLVGSEGTGKSVFQYYLLARYLNPSLFKEAPLPGPVEFGSEEPPKVIIRHVSGGGVDLWFIEKQVVHRIDSRQMATLLSCFDPAESLYFYEPGKTHNLEPYACKNSMYVPPTLATMPPDWSSYNQFSKIADVLYMPVFTEEELLTIGRDMRGRPDVEEGVQELFSDEAIRGRFAMFNGIIRHVLPMDEYKLDRLVLERNGALERIEAVSFLAGEIERRTLSDYLAVYAVEQPVDGQGDLDFAKRHTVMASTEVEKYFREALERMTLNEKVSRLKSRRELKTYKFRDSPAIYEGVVAGHLSSLGGVNWRQRRGTVVSPLQLRVRRLDVWTFPVFADMAPDTLYKAYTPSYPFCDRMIKVEEGGASRLVCIHVSLEPSGHCILSAGAFTHFCRRLGLIGEDEMATEKETDMVTFIFVPDPLVADKAQITFEDGLVIKDCVVWHVDEDFSNGVL